MTRMATIAGLIVLGAVLLIVVLSGGGSSYKLQMKLTDASGLRDGSAVVVGGVNVGTVSLHVSPDRQSIVADLNIDKQYVPVGTNVAANIAAVNLLGVKDVELTVGNKSTAAPSGFVIPASRVTTATDLDQVLDVLDQNTRARLAVLINEAGASFIGRRADFSNLLKELPNALSDGTTLLGQFVSDNHTLGNLLSSSNAFLASADGQQHALGSLIDSLGQTGVTVAAKNAQVRATLANAPAALAQLQTFLNKLQATAVPLGPAARDIVASAGPLTDTLAQLDPFRKAAQPTLTEARTVAPLLTQLASGATPVLQRAKPVAQTLAHTSVDLTGVSEMLNKSADNLIGVLDNWAKATSLGDNVSHVFRGEASYSTEALTSAVNNLLGTNLGVAANKPQQRAGKPAPAPIAAPKTPAGSQTRKTTSSSQVVRQLTQTLQNLLGGVTNSTTGTVNSLLNGSKPTQGGQQDSSGNLSSLLSYLLGK